MNRNEAYSLTDTMVKGVVAQDRGSCAGYDNPGPSPASAVTHAMCLLPGRVKACHDQLDKLNEALGMALRPSCHKTASEHERTERETGASELVERLLCIGDDLAGVIQRMADLNQRLTL